MVSVSRVKPSIPGNASSESSRRTARSIRIARSRDRKRSARAAVEPIGNRGIVPHLLPRTSPNWKYQHVADQIMAHSPARSSHPSACAGHHAAEHHHNPIARHRSRRGTQSRRHPAQQRPVSQSYWPGRASGGICEQQSKQQPDEHHACSLRIDGTFRLLSRLPALRSEALEPAPGAEL